MVRFVTLVRDFSVCFVSVEADVVMCFGPINGCMIPLMQYSTWTAISSLRDLDRWLVYSVCSGCLARWTLDYTCSSAVFDFGKGRESPQHARRSLWRVIFGGFLTSNDCERSEQMNVESVERTYIYLLNTWTQYPERFYASCIRSVYRAVSMHGEVSQLPAIYIFSDIVDSNSAIILTSLRHQSSWLRFVTNRSTVSAWLRFVTNQSIVSAILIRFVTNQSTVSAIPILKSVDCI